MNGQDHDSESDIDARFAEIIAGWDDDDAAPEAPTRRDPAVDIEPDDLAPHDHAHHDLAPHERKPDDRGHRDDDAGPAALPDQAANQAFPFPVWRGPTTPAGDAGAEALDPDVDDPDDHFSRPEIQPLPPGEDLHFWGIVIGLVAGPLLLLWLVLFRPNVSSWWTLLALALSLGGFVLLVLRQPRDRDGDDDNGARI